MSDDQSARQPFKVQRTPSASSISIELCSEFRIENWEAFSSFTTANIENGIINWDIDLRRVVSFSSMMMGAVIGLNTVLQCRGGRLCLIIEKQSRIGELLYLTKLNRIVSVHEVDPEVV